MGDTRRTVQLFAAALLALVTIALAVTATGLIAARGYTGWLRVSPTDVAAGLGFGMLLGQILVSSLIATLAGRARR